MKNLAITSPSTTDYPETFIQSLIDGIKENVTYFEEKESKEYMQPRTIKIY